MYVCMCMCINYISTNITVSSHTLYILTLDQYVTYYTLYIHIHTIYSGIFSQLIRENEDSEAEKKEALEANRSRRPWDRRKKVCVCILYCNIVCILYVLY